MASEMDDTAELLKNKQGRCFVFDCCCGGWGGLIHVHEVHVAREAFWHSNLIQIVIEVHRRKRAVLI